MNRLLIIYNLSFYNLSLNQILYFYIFVIFEYDSNTRKYDITIRHNRFHYYLYHDLISIPYKYSLII